MEQQVRTLLAWLPQQEAINTLLGHMPAPAEDTAPHRLKWENAQRALQQRNDYALDVPQLGSISPDMQAAADIFRQRADVNATFQGLDWSLGITDLNSVLSFQKLVVLEHAVDRANAVVINDPKSLFSFCLPDLANEATVPGALDADQRAITFSSLNPNLRIGGHAVIEMDAAAAAGQPPTRQKVVGFTINFGAQFIQVAEYNGRWFVRDGYHRCYGLLRRGIHQIPCVFIRARSFPELVPNAEAFLPYEILFGDRPAFLRDFLDDSVSATVARMATRKVIRISAEEFVVLIE